MSEAALRIDDHDGSVSTPALNGQTNGAATDGATASADVSIAIVVPPPPNAERGAPDSSSNGSSPHGPDAPPAAPAAEMADARQGAPPRVADIRKNSLDGRGEKIDFVFFRRNNFVIYRSGGKIMVQYADDEATAAKQIADIAELLPLRDRLQSLSSGMVASQACHWQIAETLRLGLDGQKAAARQSMERAIDDINMMRVRRGRIVYLECAGALVVAVVALLGGGAAATEWYWAEALDLKSNGNGIGLLLMATASGAVGALLSTAIALRARSVAIDGDVLSNAVDSTVRIMIGVISAAALFLMLSSNLLPNVSVATMPLLKSDGITWKIALLIGFAAGFLERLVPDLLEKRLAPVPK
jgi:hypothetical protein